MFRAFDPANDRSVAVKLFTIDLAPELAHRFVADLDRLVAAELTHPAIARPIATGILGNSPYLVEEFIEAESLDIVLRVHGPAPVPDALRIAAQIAGALDFAAVSHVHHGALHPRDVLLSNQEIRITGLGVARALEQVGVSAPTRRPYAAPERISGTVWHRFADIFSLAALMHEMLWGRRITGVGMQAVASLEPLQGSDLTSLSIAFSRALAEDPGGRYSRALKFVEALKNAFASHADTGAIQSSHAFPPSADATEPVAEQGDGAPWSDPPIVVQPPGTATAPIALTYEPEPELALADEEPSIDIGVAQTAVAEPEPPPEARLKPPDPGQATPTESEALAERPSATLPFELGPRRRDRVRYAPPEPDVEPELHDIEPEPLASGSTVLLEHPPLTTVERSRSAIWPIALALLLGAAIGIGVGFGGGYWTGFRESARPSDTADTAAAPAPQAREYTDSAVAQPPKPAAPPTAAATQQAAAPVDARPKARSPERDAERRPAAAAPHGSGSILVRSTPAGARVSVDGRDYGVTPLAVRDLPAGVHTVRVVRDGYATLERAVRLTRARPSQSMIVTLDRPRATAAASFTGGLSVDSRPPGAKVYIDGRLVGTTPLQAPAVSAGEHAIRLERDGYRRWTSAVRVVSNEQNRVTASLER